MAEFVTSTGLAATFVMVMPAGKISLTKLLPSPTMILDAVPLTVQLHPKLEASVYNIKYLPVVSKFAGEVPVPSVFVPQVAIAVRFPADLL
jgi:hypothetical protein